MKTKSMITLTVACALSASLGNAVCANGAKPPPNPASQVRAILRTKCSECHGRALRRPRGSLYLDDLARLAANRDLVVPHNLEKSHLWTLIRAGDMPAKGAQAGPLDAQEKESVRSWIAAGAPVPSWPATTAPMPSAPAQAAPAASGSIAPMPAPTPLSLTKRVFSWFGKFHIHVIHFPIALLAAAALGEMVAAIRGIWIPEPAVRFCVLLGASSALSSVVLGWLHADVGGHGIVSLLGIHRWLGTTAGMMAVGMALISERDSRRHQRSSLFRVLLWGGAFLIAVAAHFGGLMVHGQDFFDL